MSQGQKTERITIQKLKTDAEGLVRSASGKPDLTDPDNWTVMAPRWAKVEEIGGREYQQEGQVRAETTHLVTVEFDSATRQTTSEMRIVWDDAGAERILDVTRAVGDRRQPGGARRDLIIECKEHDG